jgi:hypothetical protein
MVASNNIPKKNERGNLSFSFSENSKQVSVEDLLSTVKASLHSILHDRHSHYAKREVLNKHGRLNFACPYCGDSTHDSHKKRGNIYISKGFYFKCYNCGKFRGIEGFLRDFKVEMQADEIVLARSLQETFKSSYNSADPLMFLDKDNLSRWAFERSEIEEKYKLVPLDKTKIFVYLKKRLQNDMTKFSWSEEKQQLYIFHIIPETTKVIGYQIRNFKYKPKYMTYKLSRIYEEFGRDVPEEVYELDDISTSFGILKVDFSQPITVFEGPLDSFLYKNSVATCSSNIDIPISVGNVRYLYDYDKAGTYAAIQRANEGKSVFLWKKLLEDMKIETPINKLDLTDFLVYCKRKNLNIPLLSNYFSKDKYDIYYL